MASSATVNVTIIDPAMPKNIPCHLAVECATSIAHYCLTRFPCDTPPHPMLDVPWFAEQVQKCIDTATTIGLDLKRSLEDAGKELKARKEILDSIADICSDGNCWADALDWRKRLRDFASDAEQHDITRNDWKADRDEIESITLYSHGGFFTAYFDDAAALWEMSDDDLPMFHVMIKSDPPHRTCIHPIHLVVWLQQMADAVLPVRVMGRN